MRRISVAPALAAGSSTFSAKIMGDRLRINGRAVKCSGCEPVSLGVLVLAFALVHVAPTELGQIKLVAVGIQEPDELAGLAVVDHSLELQAFGSQSLHGVFDWAVQFQANRHGAFPSC